MYAQARSGGGTGTPVTPLDSLDMHHPRPPLEPEAGSNLLNSKFTFILRFFTFLINRQCHNLSILWLFLKFFLIYNIFFFAWFHLKWLVIMVRWLMVSLQVDYYRFKRFFFLNTGFLGGGGAHQPLRGCTRKKISAPLRA